METIGSFFSLTPNKVADMEIASTNDDVASDSDTDAKRKTWNMRLRKVSADSFSSHLRLLVMNTRDNSVMQQQVVSFNT